MTIVNPIFDAAQHHSEQNRRRAAEVQHRIDKYPEIQATAAADAAEVERLRIIAIAAAEASAKAHADLDSAMQKALDSKHELTQAQNVRLGRDLAI